MSERFNGMQYIIVNSIPLEIWFPCAARYLNLVGKNSVEYSKIIAMLFERIQNNLMYLDHTNIE